MSYHLGSCTARYLPDEGFSRLHNREFLSSCVPPSPCVFTLASSLISSSSLSSAADSLSDGSGEVTLTSTLISPGWGCVGASEWQEEEEEGGGGVCASGSRAAVGALLLFRSALESSAGKPSGAPAASFCF